MSDLVESTEDRFSHDAVHIISVIYCHLTRFSVTSTPGTMETHHLILATSTNSTDLGMQLLYSHPAFFDCQTNAFRPSFFYFLFYRFFSQQVSVGGQNKNKNKINSDHFPIELKSKETQLCFLRF